MGIHLDPSGGKNEADFIGSLGISYWLNWVGFLSKKALFVVPRNVCPGWLAFWFCCTVVPFFFWGGKLEPEITNLQNDSSQFSQEQEEQRAKVRYTMNLPKCEGPPPGGHLGVWSPVGHQKNPAFPLNPGCFYRDPYHGFMVIPTELGSIIPYIP